ncbi:dihydroorotate dehydrogenase, partial [Brachyspira pilosicoli]|uniref:dihydroorotate dehydrogenase n=1 Tax=Brachyspira pilosicoli TaxID=52584 RepID=UPI001CA5365E
LNINGSTLEEYVKVAEIANEIERVDFIELNISCPNVKNGGMAFGASCESAEKTTKEVKKVLTKKPLIVKLSPNVTDIISIAKSVEYAGADSVSLVNTFLAMKIDIKTKKPLLGNIFGGLSGAAIMPIALRMVYQVYKAVKIPIVGMGGIQKYEDALEFIMAGASVVSIGSGIFSNPLLPIEIIKQMNNYLEENNINNIKDLIGVAHL